jgi:hypothetical protein
MLPRNLVMIRTVKISLGSATKTKIRKLLSLTCRLRKYTNDCIDYIWNSNTPLKELSYKNVYPTSSITHSHIQFCWRQACSITNIARKLNFKNLCKKPILKHSVQLSAQTSRISIKLKHFDYALKISGR